MKKIIVLLAMSMSQIVAASESSDYMASVLKSVTAIQNLKKDCSAASVQSDCIKNYLSSTKITNSTEIALLAPVAAGASLQDKSHGLAADEAKLKMLENILLIMEKVNTKDFYLGKRPQNTEVDLLKKDDEKGLASERERMISILSKPIDELIKNPATYSKALPLLMRLNNLKSVKWAY
jgi:hypothetical protein